MSAYYNERDPFAAQWLRNLVSAGHIAPGDVDERDVWDVLPEDLRGFTQCHFFAGIGIWSYALRRADWADDRPVWTGSCPCQPFSAAGKGLGENDPRHLWPAFRHLIRVCKPPVVLGEQVASKDGLRWFEGLQADMEAAGYAVGALDTCAAGFADDQGNEGFHIRQRIYWGARRLEDAQLSAQQRLGQHGSQGVCVEAAARPARGRMADQQSDAGRGDSGVLQKRGLGHTESDGRFGRQDDGDSGRRECASGQAGAAGAERLAAADEQIQSGRGILRPGEGIGEGVGAALQRPAGLCTDSNGVDWLPCRDGKQRPVESGTFPLAYEDSSRVGRLRAYGNALDAAQAEGFVAAFMECLPS